MFLQCRVWTNSSNLVLTPSVIVTWSTYCVNWCGAIGYRHIIFNETDCSWRQWLFVKKWMFGNKRAALLLALVSCDRISNFLIVCRHAAIQAFIFYISGVRVYENMRGGLMDSALDFGSNGPGSSPGWETMLCSWSRHLTLIVPLFVQLNKWLPANCWATWQNDGE